MFPFGTNARRLIATMWVLTPVAVAWGQGTAVGRYASGLVDQTIYTFCHQNRLYTHDGDNRGYGAQHNLAALNIESDMIAAGLFVTRHTFVYNGSTYYNIVGERGGATRPDEVYIVGAHFDSVNNPGADDNASGTAAVLELARLIGQWESDATIRLIAFDREEQGLIGSDEYVSDHLGDDIRGMVTLDMIAYHPGGAYAVRIYGRTASNAVKLPLRDAAEDYGGLQVTINGSLDASDHAPFEWAGFPAALLIEDDVWSNPYYHTQDDSVDTPGNINYILATRITQATLGWLVDAAGVRPPHPKGDCDGSYEIDSFDIAAFVLALTDRSAYELAFPGVSWLGTADVNGDGAVDSFDIASFVALVTGP